MQRYGKYVLVDLVEKTVGNLHNIQIGKKVKNKEDKKEVKNVENVLKNVVENKDIEKEIVGKKNTQRSVVLNLPKEISVEYPNIKDMEIVFK